jgi:hypothetical protein
MARDHVGHDPLGEVDHSFDVDVDEPEVIVEVDAGEGATDADAGVEDGDLERAPGFGGPLPQSLDFVAFGQARADGVCVDAQSTQVVGAVTAAGDDEVVTAAGELAGDLQA